jgi:hypothetical protein
MNRNQAYYFMKTKIKNDSHSTICNYRLQVSVTCKRVLRVQLYQNVVHRLILPNWLRTLFKLEAHIIAIVIGSKNTTVMRLHCTLHLIFLGNLLKSTFQEKADTW